MEDNKTKKFLHIAFFPFLAFGHIIPYFELSKLIAQKGHKVSFISTPRNIKRLPSLPSSLQPFINFVELPLPHVDKLPENAEATTDIPEDIVPYLKIAFDGLQQPLTQFLETSTPDCILYDFGPYWLPPITTKLGILTIHFSIINIFCTSYVMELFFGKSGDEENVISDVHFKHNDEENAISGVSDMFRATEILRGADSIAIRTCMEIEGSKSLETIENLSKKKVIPVGLLAPSLEFSEDKKDENWDTILKWLDKQEKGSVVYVAFGSEVRLSDEEFTEIAKGLELSTFPFLWIVKNRVVETENDSNKKGLIWNKWAPQLRILAHESIGGFLTHSGWSSVIESLQVGCPLILLPFRNDQGLNAILMEEKMVGPMVEKTDGKFNRDSVAKALRLVMVEEEGKIYRSKAQEMSKIVGDKELQQKYIDDFVDYVELNVHAIKH